MRLRCAVVTFFLLSEVASAQADSTHEQRRDVSIMTDTLRIPIQESIGSAKDSVGRVRDSLNLSFTRDTRIDSIRAAFLTQQRKLEGLSLSLHREMDSLRSAGQPVVALQAKVDSVQQRLEQVTAQANSGIQKLRRAAQDKLAGISVPAELKGEREKVLNSIDGLEQDLRLTRTIGAASGISSHTSLDNLPAVSRGTNIALPEDKLTQLNMPDVPVQQGLPANANQLSGIDARSIETTAESKVSDFIDKDAIDQQLSELPGQDVLTAEGAKNEVVTQARTVAMNHFFGRQKELEAAMEQMRKLK